MKYPEQIGNSIKWTAFSTNIDVETGEVLKVSQLKNYIHESTEKFTHTNNNKSRGYIEYTKFWRRNPQGKLPFGEKI